MVALLSARFLLQDFLLLDFFLQELSHFTEVGKCRNLFTPSLAHLTLSLAARVRSASELCKGKGEKRRSTDGGGGKGGGGG